LPSTFDAHAAAPAIAAENVGVKFLIRYHRREITLRETLIRLFERPGAGRGPGGRWREEFWALRGVNLTVRPGETIGVIGPNGSGKTTLLKTLAGILGADQGRVAVRGRVGCLLSFGVGFNPALSGRENVYLNGSLLGLARRTIDARMDAIVAMSELGDFINAPVRTYSAGMRGRLGFAIAVHIDPDVLMLDEVLGVGDAAFRAKTGTILERFRRARKTVVIASHSMSLIRETCDRAVWLEKGTIRLEGPPEEVVRAYLESTEAGGGAARAHRAEEPEEPRRQPAEAPSLPPAPERFDDQFEARLRSAVEYYTLAQQQHLDEVRYRLGDALVKACGSPKDFLCLPGRLIALFFAGLRRRRERRRQGAPSAPSVGEVLETAPLAPHLGTGCDPRQTVFAAPPSGSRVRVAAILDTFSHACVAPECDLVTFRPDNWANVLRTTGARLLLVESAWHGNDGAWQYRIASYPQHMGDELLDLAACCRRNGVPTVFWNKEDPAHFDRFIGKARAFDAVCTTDALCVPRYKEALGHGAVHVLPFAAQPVLHNPIRREERRRAPCFAGAYYAARHEQRREDMAMLLRPAMRFGLDIYDRMHGAPPKERADFLFPEEYRPAVRGRLEYGEMVAAYKRYRVFLNVNSVVHSPTMFSRRVFELLACGTPVITTPSDGIGNLLGANGVFVARSEAETEALLQKLLHDDDAWAEASALGIRKVLSEHTYAVRFAALCRAAGIAAAEREDPLVSVIAAAEPGEELDRIADCLRVQTYRRFEAHVFSDAPLAAAEIDALRRKLGGAAVHRWPRTGAAAQSYRGFFDKAQGAIACNLHPGFSYGEDYLADCVMFFQVPGVAVQGKACRFVADAGGRIVPTGAECEHRMVREAPSGTIAALKSSLSPGALHALLTQPTFAAPGESIYSTYRYNCCEAPAHAARAGGAPWTLRMRG